MQLPNGSTIASTHTGTLQLPNVPTAACQADILPSLRSGSLVSIGKLCDHGCTAVFSKDKVEIHNADSALVAQGPRAPTGLWHLELETPTQPAGQQEQSSNGHTTRIAQANLSTLAQQTAGDRIAFLHGAAGYPVVSTWIKAIEAGHFATWPGLSAAAVRRHLPASIITAKGHLDQQRANRQSTKPKSNNKTPLRIIPEPPTTTKTRSDTDRTGFIYADCQPITGQIYSDLPGKFLVPSSRGYNYQIIVYDHDSTAILAEPLKDRTGPEIVRGFKVIHAKLVSRGLKPRLQRLDNEASAALRKFLDEEGIDFQLAPPHLHRRNAAERAIRTYKNHFIAILCGTDPDFPLHLWDRLNDQVLLTLNLLRTSRINPHLSAHAQLFGAFDFNRTPIGPLGTKVLVHEKPDVRETWAPHGVPGWYIGPAPAHYRCYTVHIIETKRQRIADTLAWFPHHTPLPKTASIDAATAAANDLIEALRNPAPADPFAGLNTEKLAALGDLADIFKTSLPTSDTPNDARSKTSGDITARAPRVLTSTNNTRATPAKPSTTSAPPTAAPPIHPGLPPRTYTSMTRNPGQRRRAARRTPTAPPRLQPSTAPNNLTNNSAPLPRVDYTSSTAPPVTAPTTTPHHHQHGTRSKTRRAPDPTANATVAPTPRKPPPPSPCVAPVANAVIDPITGKATEYRQLIRQPETKKRWLHGMAKELGRLTQGLDNSDVEGTDTMFFIPHTALPAGRKPTYTRVVVDERPQKADPYRVRVTVGGDRIDYPGNVSTPTADITTAKLVFNSTISTPGAKFMTVDIKNFYLGTPMERYEYMWIPLDLIPQVIIDQYNLNDLAHNGRVLVEIRKGMYGLPQAGQLAYERLVIHLAKYGYAPTRHTPGLWKHHTRPILFSLVVDDFGVKYIDKNHAEHLVAALRDLYEVTLDWDGTRYLGLTLKWDYKQGTVDVSMPGYVAAALHRFQHPEPTRDEDSPHAWVPPNYGSTIQLSPLEDTSPPLDKPGITRVQQIIGTLLYYARAIDSTMLVALSTLSAVQSKSTDATADALTRLLNYAASHPDAIVRYHASGMILWIHSDASYLCEPKARSRVGGHFFLSSLPVGKLPHFQTPKHNGAIHNVCSILTNVMSSATEAEIGGLFHNGKDAASLRLTLIDMGHPQPPTPIQTDNAAADGIVNGTVRQRKSKAMDMRFYWIQDRIRQGQFAVYWRPGATNLADYFTKHHPTSHHREMRYTYLHKPSRIMPTAPATRTRPTVPSKGVFIVPSGSTDILRTRRPTRSSGPVIRPNVSSARLRPRPRSEHRIK